MNSDNRMRIMLVAAAICLQFGTAARGQTLEQAFIDGSIELNLGDEAFTEPIESIQVACAESGIVGSIRVKRGDRVAASQLLLELDMSVLESSRRVAAAKAGSTARLHAAEIEFEQKRKRFGQLSKLLEENAGSPQEVERAQTDMQVAAEHVEAIREEQEQFKLELAQIESRMECRRVRSPIAGVITEVRRKPGEFVSPHDPHVVTVVQLETLRAVFHLPTAQAAAFEPGNRVQVLLQETNQTSSATVDYVAPVTSADSGRVRIDVMIDNREQKFRSGVRCRIIDHKLGSATIGQASRMAPGLGKLAERQMVDRRGSIRETISDSFPTSSLSNTSLRTDPNRVSGNR